MSPSVVIVGAGNMAHHLALAFSKSNVNLVQVYNRSRKGLSRISALTGVSTTTSKRKIMLADVYILAVSDDAIESVSNELSTYVNKNALIAHTSGACTINVFEKMYQKFGAFYPLQSLKKERLINFKNIPIFISANIRSVDKIFTHLAKSISNNVISIEDKKRSALHIPAVLVNNFVNHIYHLAYEFCQNEDLDLNHLMPLMEETLDRIKDGTPPFIQQTGPAIRNDKNTIKLHQQKLREYPDTLKLYNYLTRHIQNHYNEDR